MDDVTAKVARQYSQHAYPHPTNDLAKAQAEGAVDWADPSLFREQIWPEGGPLPGYRLLVAGCGTTQAARLAFTNPDVEIFGIDLSEVSLGHQRYLKAKHGLNNLSLYQGDLREVGKLGSEFDLIVSTGVLHHLADPSEGLSALREVLAPDGAMFLMVYGAAGRHGIYMMQDAFRRLGLGQSDESVAMARKLLASVSQEHPVARYLRRSAELEHDTALVDTFLHPQDRAYTVPQLLEWLSRNDLEFQAWSKNQFYYPEALIDPAFRPLIRALPESEQWAVVETLLAFSSNHSFVARHLGKAQLISASDPKAERYRPVLMPGAEIEMQRADGTGTIRLLELRFEMTQGEMLFAALIDGRRTVEEIMNMPVFAAFPAEDRRSFGRMCVDRFWKIGVAMFGAAPA